MSNERTGVLELTLGDTYIGSAYSPQVSIDDIEGGHRLTVTYDDEEQGITSKSFDVMNGEKGETGDVGPQGTQGEIGPIGPQGPAGASPTAYVERVEGGAEVTVTDASGTTTAMLYDAELTDGSVTEAKLSDGAVTGAKLAQGAVTGPKIVPKAVTADKLDVSTTYTVTDGDLTISLA